MSRQYVTLDEANDQLVELRERLTRIMLARGQSKTILARLERAGFAPTSDDFQPTAPGASIEVVRERSSLRALVDLVRADVQAVMDLGCMIKDLEVGLVDWYCRAPGRDVLLCWKLGERQVGFWHELETGFAGRRPIGELQGAGTRPPRKPAQS